MKTKFDPVEVERLYVDEGLSLRQVAAQVGCSIEWARQLLRDSGVPLRPRHISRYASNYQGRKSQERKPA